MRSYRFIVIVLSWLFNRIGCVLTNRSDNCRIACRVTFTTSILSLTFFLVTNLNVGEMILVVPIDCPCDAVSGNRQSSLLLTLRNTTLVSIDELVLGGIVGILRVMERITANLNLATIHNDFLAIFSLGIAAPLFRLLSLCWFLWVLFLGIKNTSWGEYPELKRILRDSIHRSLSEFPPWNTLSDCWSVQIIET